MEQTPLPTTRAEEIAGDVPYTVGLWPDDRPNSRKRYTIKGPTPCDSWWHNFEEVRSRVDSLNAAYAKGYTSGQQYRWIPVAMIHNDYDASVRCSNCGDAGGFGVYDDLEWAKHCPGCGRPISEQVDAKGVRTPHPLYAPPNPEQR